MALLTGLDGAFSFDTGFGIDINSWTADLTIETADTTSFDATGTTNNVGWRTRVPVVGSLTATASGFLEQGVTPLHTDVLDGNGAFDIAAMTGTLLLTAKGGHTWQCNAVLTGASLGVTVGAASTGSYTFESNGIVTQAWS